MSFFKQISDLIGESYSVQMILKMKNGKMTATFIPQIDANKAEDAVAKLQPLTITDEPGELDRVLMSVISTPLNATKGFADAIKDYEDGLKDAKKAFDKLATKSEDKEEKKTSKPEPKKTEEPVKAEEPKMEIPKEDWEKEPEAEKETIEKAIDKAIDKTIAEKAEEKIDFEKKEKVAPKEEGPVTAMKLDDITGEDMEPEEEFSGVDNEPEPLDDEPEESEETANETDSEEELW